MPAFSRAVKKHVDRMPHPFDGAPRFASYRRMGTIRCARCGRPEDEASASYGEEGLLCQWCLQNVKALDAAQAAATDGPDPLVGSHVGMLMSAVLRGETDGNLASMERGSYPSPPLPPDGAHAALEARGAHLERSGQRERSTWLGSARDSDGYSERWLLPARPSVQASFVHEGLRQKLGKLFTRELETGDEDFDKAVFIATTTPAETRALLARPEALEAIYTAVTHGGLVTIDGNLLEGKVLWPLDHGGPWPQDLFARLGLLLLEG